MCLIQIWVDLNWAGLSRLKYKFSCQFVTINITAAQPGPFNVLSLLLKALSLARLNLSSILSYIVKLFTLNTSLLIRSRLKCSFIMILTLKTCQAIRICAEVTMLCSVVIGFFNIDQIWSRSFCSLCLSININELFHFVNLSVLQALKLCD